MAAILPRCCGFAKPRNHGGKHRHSSKKHDQGGSHMAKLEMSVGRRTLLKAGAALGASQIIGAPFVIASRGDEPVKIGMVNPLTGVLSALAQSEVDGAKY